ncbi:hypothetical protein CYMTET_50447 [Cymbomonas tetramitiformis]|uniref:Uncharacterized protein n=1 Tax=Cymbomonas tetramitiformis TaxID=36881 RepID=A0AAE0ETG7_9CHLO|nr:hypothetical protein CYMTET_50447 [Cymbomonas tetramitiformis]
MISTSIRPTAPSLKSNCRSLLSRCQALAPVARPSLPCGVHLRVRSFRTRTRYSARCVLKPPVDNSTEQQGNHQLFGETSLPQFLQQAEAAGFANPFLGLTPSDYTDFRNQQPNPDHMPSVSYILDFYGGKWQQACRAADISCDKLTNAVQQGRMLRFLNEQSAGGLTMKMYVQVSQASRRYCQQSLPSLQELRREFGSWQEACRSVGFEPVERDFFLQALKSANEWNLRNGRDSLTVTNYRQIWQNAKFDYADASYEYVLKFFGTWQIACQEAGISPGTAGNNRHKRENSVKDADRRTYTDEELLEMYQQGSTMQVIGDKIGVTREMARCRLNNVSTAEERRLLKKLIKKQKDIDRHVQVYRETGDVHRVAKVLCVSKSGVLKRLHQAGTDFDEDPNRQSIRHHLSQCKVKNENGKSSADMFKDSETIECLQMAAAHYDTDTLSVTMYRRFSKGRNMEDGRRFPSSSVIKLSHERTWSTACQAAGLKCGGDGRRWQKPRRFNEACITASVKEFLCWAEKTPTVPVPSRGAYTLWRDQMMQDDPSMVGALPTISTIQAFCRSRRSHGLPSNWISFVCELYESMDTECSMHVE